MKKRLAARHVSIELTNDAVMHLVRLGNQPEMGARPLRRVIEQSLEDPLAEKLLLHPNESHNFVIKVENDKLIFEEQEVHANQGV